MQQYPIYEQEQQSVLSDLFGTPTAAFGTLQKASMSLNLMNSSMWRAAKTGAGINWSGVVGLRGIAMGEKAFGNRVGRALSPFQATKGSIAGINSYSAARFTKFGLFGSGGLLNKTGDNKLSNTLGRFFGGGLIESSKFDMSGKNFIADIPDDKIRPIAENIYKGRIKNETLSHLTDKDDWSLAQRILTKKQGKEYAIKQKVISKNVGRIAKVARLASWVTMASIGFDIGSAVGSSLVHSVGNAADALDNKLNSLINKKMEFGGKVGIGFYSQRSGTERQRALSAMGGGYQGSPAFGNEAGYSHVASTF